MSTKLTLLPVKGKRVFLNKGEYFPFLGLILVHFTKVDPASFRVVSPKVQPFSIPLY
jgi:hypothetical protein